MSKSPSVQANWKIRFEDEALLKKDGFPDLFIKKDTMTTVLVTYNNNNQQPRRKRRGMLIFRSQLNPWRIRIRLLTQTYSHYMVR